MADIVAGAFYVIAAAVASALLAIEGALPHARIMRVERIEDVEEAVLPRSA